MYPETWHQIYSNMTGNSARQILPDLLRLFDARSVIEIGCGNGHWTQAAIDTGIKDYRVVDGPWNNPNDLLVDRSHFTEADLGEPLDLGRRFDFGICLEVAEHVRGDRADILIDTFERHTDVLLLGAAIPMQGGYGHINEQWPSWWRDKMIARGYAVFDLVRPKHWTDQSIHYWYRQNAFVYVKESNQAAMERGRQAAIGTSSMLFDAVHPEKFDEVASYRSIAGKRLAKELPQWVYRRLKARLSGGG